MSALLTLGYIATIFLIFVYLIEVWGLFTKSPVNMRVIDWFAALCGTVTLIIVINSYNDKALTLIKIIAGFVIINVPVIVVYMSSLFLNPVQNTKFMDFLFSAPIKNKKMANKYK